MPVCKKCGTEYESSLDRCPTCGEPSPAQAETDDVDMYEMLTSGDTKKFSLFPEETEEEETAVSDEMNEKTAPVSSAADTEESSDREKAVREMFNAEPEEPGLGEKAKAFFSSLFASRKHRETPEEEEPSEEQSPSEEEQAFYPEEEPEVATVEEETTSPEETVQEEPEEADDTETDDISEEIGKKVVFYAENNPNSAAADLEPLFDTIVTEVISIPDLDEEPEEKAAVDSDEAAPSEEDHTDVPELPVDYTDHSFAEETAEEDVTSEGNQDSPASDYSSGTLLSSDDAEAEAFLDEDEDEEPDEIPEEEPAPKEVYKEEKSDALLKRKGLSKVSVLAMASAVILLILGIIFFWILPQKQAEQQAIEEKENAYLEFLCDTWMSDVFIYAEETHPSREVLTLTTDMKYQCDIWTSSSDREAFDPQIWSVTDSNSGTYYLELDTASIRIYYTGDDGQEYVYRRYIRELTEDKLVLREYYNENLSEYYDVTFTKFEG